MALKQLRQGRKLAKTVIKTAVLFIAVMVVCGGFFAVGRFVNEKKVLHEIIARLKADSRIADFGRREYSAKGELGWQQKNFP